MTPNLNDLLIFLTVAETQSITGTADQVGLTKSAVSQALKRLEEQLGRRLLYRTTRAMALTDEGARLLPYCRALREAQQDMMAALTDDDAPQSLTITAPHALMQPVMVPAVGALSEGRDLRLRLLAEDGQVNLTERQIDLAIRVGGSAPQSARVTRIGTLHESLYCAPGYLTMQPEHISDLAAFPHVSNDWQGDPVDYGGKLRVSPRFRVNTVHEVRALIAQGLGIGLLPDLFAQGDPALMRLFPVSSSPIYALHQQGRTPSKIVTQLVAQLRAALR